MLTDINKYIYLQSRLLARTASNDPRASTSREQASPCAKRARDGTVPSGKHASLRSTTFPCSKYWYSVLWGKVVWEESPCATTVAGGGAGLSVSLCLTLPSISTHFDHATHHQYPFFGDKVNEVQECRIPKHDGSSRQGREYITLPHFVRTG